jgi:hypothetical protein
VPAVHCTSATRDKAVSRRSKEKRSIGCSNLLWDPVQRVVRFQRGCDRWKSSEPLVIKHYSGHTVAHLMTTFLIMVFEYIYRHVYWQSVTSWCQYTVP